ncbi:hypothetical protein LTR62_004630 [Meristemomyces frigidus]|uniref:Phosphoribosylaminoimidazole-succinocarboxamide synthase n=1 Tax=Meristemomyces frigidus TaxID=1508187 RepID=A0AAN7THF5_9PEZI|nr:hypothetical protein LTR62_004630 [Meristemomyces frigidus]
MSQQARTPTTATISPIGLALRHTNVSHPSLVEHKPSLQSVTASEDYYSLRSAGSSGSSGEIAVAGRSENTIHRYRTPPSRYRTPLQSRDYLPVAGGEVESEGEVRKTPMRGQGRRRQSLEREGGSVANTAVAVGAPVLREGGIRRKPVPSMVLESPALTPGRGERDDWPKSEEEIDPIHARSSAARDLDRDMSPPTPGVDDTPYIRFALDQLTRDEEVRGSRRYRGLGSGVDNNYPYLVPAPAGPVSELAARNAEAPGMMTVVEPAAARTSGGRSGMPMMMEQGRQRTPPFEQRRDFHDTDLLTGAAAVPLIAPLRADDVQLPLRNPNRLSDSPLAPIQPQPFRHQRQIQADTRFLPVSDANNTTNEKLTFLPSTLRPLGLILYLLAIVLYTICLLFCAIYSLLHTGLWRYGSFGDGRYFVFQYLPTLLGMVLFFWTVQVEVAVYRIAPFVAMASLSPTSRRAGTELPLVPQGFVLPFFGHFRAGLAPVAFFVLVAWLQLFTIPLLASSFNVYYIGARPQGHWMWLATQGAIWTVIALYLLLALAVLGLLIWLGFGRKLTGLRWDPRSLADMVVLLERSNALDVQHDFENETEPARLGHWRTNARPNQVMHTFGIADRPARRYSLDNGRLVEKSSPAGYHNRMVSDETNEQRHSREKMLPRHENEDLESGHHSGKSATALPWFLRPSAAALWIIIAFVLLLAFLIISYLPSTTVSRAFRPDVPAPVSRGGFSSTNFLYSFLPALLGMLCLLFWLDIEYAFRRLTPYEEMVREGGAVAEKGLLLSYPSELPAVVTATAAVNGHWRLALLTLNSLVAATLPVLAGGVFWAQFYVPEQRTKISAQMTAFYPLTVFLVLYALAYLLIWPGKRLKEAGALLGRNQGSSFADVVLLLRGSRLVDDVAFHSVESKTDLVTRLLSSGTGNGNGMGGGEAGESKMSLADSVRGYGRARRQGGGVGGAGVGDGVARFGLGRHIGRNGATFLGVDRVRV